MPPADRLARMTPPAAHDPLAPEALGQWLSAHPVIVFDLDGTLVDTLPDLTGALDDALAALDLPPVHPDVVMASLHGGLAGTAAAAAEALSLDEARAHALCVAYETAYAATPALRALPFPGVLDCLHALREAGCALGVCTNKSQSDADGVLRALRLDFAFDIVVGARRGFPLKPDPAPLLHAIAMLGAHPRESVLVGDSVVDARCAHAAGAGFAHFSGGYGGAEALAAHALARFSDYGHLGLRATGPVGTAWAAASGR